MTAKELVRVSRPPVPVPQVTAADMAWMAGVVDLKGAVTRKRNKSRVTPQVVLYVRVKDERIAQRLSALTGVAPEPHDSPSAEAFLRRNCAEHCITPHVHVNEGEYPWQMPKVTSWAVTGIAAAVVLANLAPYMITYEAYAADVAGITGSFAATGKGSGAVNTALSRLSALGWQVPLAVTARLATAPAE